MKYIIIQILIVCLFGCNIFYKNKLIPDIQNKMFIHNPNQSKLIIDNDTFVNKLFKNNLILVENDLFIIFGNGKLFSFKAKLAEFDSVSLIVIDSIDGYKYDPNLKIIVVWQKSKSAFESFTVNDLKNFYYYFLMRNDIIEMNYSPDYGFLFIQSNYFANTNTLSIYPVVLKGEDINEVFALKERRIPIRNFQSFGNINKYWISVKNMKLDDSLMIYPYNKKGNFYQPNK